MALAVGLGCVAVVAGAFIATGRDDGGGDDALGDSGAVAPGSSVPDSGGAPDGEPDEPGFEPGDDNDDDNDVGEGPDDGPDEGTPLVDRLDAMIDPASPADVYPLPLDDAPGAPCPRAIDVTLRLTGPDSQPLRLIVLAGEIVVGEDIARAGYTATVVFGPEQACNDKSPVVVMVEPTSPLADVVPYALERGDTL
jgi:hypothetical protein